MDKVEAVAFDIAREVYKRAHDDAGVNLNDKQFGVAVAAAHALAAQPGGDQE